MSPADTYPGSCLSQADEDLFDVLMQTDWLE